VISSVLLQRLTIALLAVAFAGANQAGCNPPTPAPGPTPAPDVCEPIYVGSDGQCYQQYFVDLDLSAIPEDRLEDFVPTAVRYRELVLDFVEDNGLRNPMYQIANYGHYPIYYHIEEWDGPVTALAITNMTNEYARVADEWMSLLADFDPGAPTTANVKVFGFVFNEGVQIDQSFYDTYGAYPIVTGWTGRGEDSPWQVVDRATGSVSDQNWYNVEDFNSLRVAGNRTDVGATVNYSPANWAGYTHPEGIDMFFTKFWHRIPWDAVAQRQYLKMGGQILNYQTGEMRTSVLVHEMGHSFNHDDLYATSKYPNIGWARFYSVMGSTNEIGELDYVIQRMVWETQDD
jgi:hypothetical protein